MSKVILAIHGLGNKSLKNQMRRPHTQPRSGVHIAISNAKRTTAENLSQDKGQGLHNYLSEFYYELNRRYFGERLFDRLVLAVAKKTTGKQTGNQFI